MKHLLSGVAIAALMAIAAPGWGQAPMTPSSPLNAPPSAPPSAAAPAAPAPNQPGATPQQQTTQNATAPRPHRRAVHSMRLHRYGYRYYPRWHQRAMMGPSGDDIANLLNREELGRVQGPPGPGPGPGYPPPGYAPGYPPGPPGYLPPPPWFRPPPW